MFAQLRQIGAVMEFSLATMLSRLAVTAVAVVGIVSVSLVLVSVLAAAAGFKRAYSSGGANDVLLIMKASATSELGSNLGPGDIGALREVITAALGPGTTMSAESYFVTQSRLAARGVDVNVPVRGLGAAGLGLRRGFEMTRGRIFQPGTRELIVGHRAAREYSHLATGDSLRLGATQWQIVGEFRCDNEISNSELWGDSDLLQRTFSRDAAVQSLYLRLPDPKARAQVEEALSHDRRLQVQTRTEAEYYEGLSSTQSAIIRVIGYAIGIGMGCVAVFVMVGSMQASVSARSRQIRLLRALGFSGTSIFVSVVFEAVLVALLGGLLGGLLSYLLFNGIGLSTLNVSGGFTQVPFSIWVNAKVIAVGTIFAALLGLLAGLAPAFAASRSRWVLNDGAA